MLGVGFKEFLKVFGGFREARIAVFCGHCCPWHFLVGHDFDERGKIGGGVQDGGAQVDAVVGSADLGVDEVQAEFAEVVVAAFGAKAAFDQIARESDGIT